MVIYFVAKRPLKTRVGESCKAEEIVQLVVSTLSRNENGRGRERWKGRRILFKRVPSGEGARVDFSVNNPIVPKHSRQHLTRRKLYSDSPHLLWRHFFKSLKPCTPLPDQEFPNPFPEKPSQNTDTQLPQLPPSFSTQCDDALYPTAGP